MPYQGRSARSVGSGPSLRDGRMRRGAVGDGSPVGVGVRWRTSVFHETKLDLHVLLARHDLSLHLLRELLHLTGIIAQLTHRHLELRARATTQRRRTHVGIRSNVSDASTLTQTRKHSRRVVLRGKPHATGRAAHLVHL